MISKYFDDICKYGRLLRRGDHRRILKTSNKVLKKSVRKRIKRLDNAIRNRKRP